MVGLKTSLGCGASTSKFTLTHLQTGNTNSDAHYLRSRMTENVAKSNPLPNSEGVACKWAPSCRHCSQVERTPASICEWRSGSTCQLTPAHARRPLRSHGGSTCCRLVALKVGVQMVTCQSIKARCGSRSTSPLSPWRGSREPKHRNL